MRTSAPSTFSFLNFFKTSHFYVYKNYGIKYVDRYVHQKRMQKRAVKNTLKFGKYKKTNF
jgi:hypothetical protein